MELGEYLATLRKGWLVIALLALVFGGLGYAQAAVSTPTYRSSSTVYVSLAQGETVSELNQGATYAQNLVESFVQLATMPAVLQPVIDDLGLEVSPRQLRGAISADSPLNTSLIEISAVSADPQRAADLANGVAASLATAVRDLAPTNSAGRASLEMTVVAAAEPSLAPFSPKPRRDALAGAGVGLALGVLVCLLRAQLDTRVRTPKDVPGAESRVTLGQVPLDRTLVKQPRALLLKPHSPLAESYRRLAANLQFLDASRPLRTIVVSSATPGEGKSTTAVNLAIVMAEKRARVLLVDADLRSPSIADICGLEGSAGLSTVLSRQATLDDVVQEWGLPNLHVVTAGQIPPNPSQLVDGATMDAFLAEAAERYDLVVVDTPPLLALTDGAVLARKTDGALVVARSRKISRPRLAEALASLDALGATTLGVLVNGVPTPRSELRYGYGHPGRRRGLLRRRSRHDQVPVRAHRAPSRPAPAAVVATTATAPEEAPTTRGVEGTDTETTTTEALAGTRQELAPTSAPSSEAQRAGGDGTGPAASGTDEDERSGAAPVDDAGPADDAGPDASVLESTVQENAAPENAVPENPAPGDSVPENRVPENRVPEGPAPAESAAPADGADAIASDDASAEPGDAAVEPGRDGTGHDGTGQDSTGNDAADDDLGLLAAPTRRHVAALRRNGLPATSSRVPEGE